MMDRKDRKLLKTKYEQLNREIYLLLYRLDPVGIGVTVNNPHLDEYAPESTRIIPKLVKAQSLSDVREIMRKEFDFAFHIDSLIGERLDQVAEEIWNLYQKYLYLFQV